MKTITFDYTKKDGSTSERTLLALVQPSKAYSGIDLTSLDPEVAAEFVNKYAQLHADFLVAASELQAEYDVKHNYRMFLESGMSNVIEI